MADATDLHLGRRLRQRRWMLGLTQSQVGERVGIKFQQVQKYETGQNRISASRLWDLARALDVPVSHFYDGLQSAPEDQAATPETPAEIDAASVSSVLTDREAVELLRAYFTLPDTPRRRLLEFIRSFARLEALGGGAEAAPADPPAQPEGTNLQRTAV